MRLAPGVDDSILISALTEAVEDLYGAFVLQRSIKVVSLTTDDGTYALESDVAAVLAATYWTSDTVWASLQARTIDELYRRDRHWQFRDSGTPRDYALESRVLTLYPKPSATIEDDYPQVRLDVATMPTSLTWGTSLTLGRPERQALLHSAMRSLQMSGRLKGDADWIGMAMMSMERLEDFGLVRAQAVEIRPTGTGRSSRIL